MAEKPRRRRTSRIEDRRFENQTPLLWTLRNLEREGRQIGSRANEDLRSLGILPPIQIKKLEGGPGPATAEQQRQIEETRRSITLQRENLPLLVNRGPEEQFTMEELLRGNKSFAPRLTSSSLVPRSATGERVRVASNETAADALETVQLGDFQLTRAELEIVARTVAGEAAGEGREGMAAVAHVIRNRALSGSFPSNPALVSTQARQFATWDEVGPNHARGLSTDSQAFKDALEIVQLVLSGEEADPTGGALNYYANRGANAIAEPSWFSRVATAGGVQIGNHIFAARTAPATSPLPRGPAARRPANIANTRDAQFREAAERLGAPVPARGSAEATAARAAMPAQGAAPTPATQSNAIVNLRRSQIITAVQPQAVRPIDSLLVPKDVLDAISREAGGLPAAIPTSGADPRVNLPPGSLPAAETGGLSTRVVTTVPILPRVGMPVASGSAGQAREEAREEQRIQRSVVTPTGQNVTSDRNMPSTTVIVRQDGSTVPVPRAGTTALPAGVRPTISGGVPASAGEARQQQREEQQRFMRVERTIMVRNPEFQPAVRRPTSLRETIRVENGVPVGTVPLLGPAGAGEPLDMTPFNVPEFIPKVIMVDVPVPRGRPIMRPGQPATVSQEAQRRAAELANERVRLLADSIRAGAPSDPNIIMRTIRESPDEAAARAALGLAIGDRNRSSTSPSTNVFGENNAFQPTSVQNSVRMQTGY